MPSPSIETLLSRAQADQAAGRNRDAESGFRAALQIDPGSLAALYSLAVLYYQDGRLEPCLVTVSAAVARNPNSVDCHNLLGLTHLAAGAPEKAVPAFDRAIRLEPGFADAHNNLGAAREALGEHEAAEAAFRRAVEVKSDYGEASFNLGRILLWLGRPAEAAEASRNALACNPEIRDARINLAVAQQRQGQNAAAAATIEQAIAVHGEQAELYRYLGVLRQRQNDLAGAEEALKTALALDPAHVQAHDSLAGVLTDQGRIADAMAQFRQALTLAPRDSRIYSNMLLCMNYVEEDSERLFAEHRVWAERQTQGITPLPAAPVKKGQRRLRVGYVSGDFRQHSVAYFFEPLLSHRNAIRFEIFCYATNEDPDAVSERLQRLSDHWRWVSGLGDGQLAERIRSDGIDILVDLSGHTAGNRLGAFLCRPAPVQVSWCGYPNTTGLAAMDYRIVDAITDPPGADNAASETLIRMPNGYLCYRPPADAPPPTPPPAVKRGYITFGSFNNLRKVTPGVIRLWSRLLRDQPGARLLLKAKPLADAATAARVSDQFAGHGIDPARLTLRGPVAGLDAHLAAYADMDIALDPFPYNGTTTTCEALWMGVPVVTLAGNRHAGRVGVSLLTRTGMAECVAADGNEYVEIATRLARDVGRLADWRRGFRDRLMHSPLCDANGFTREMEAAFERMWRDAGPQTG